MGQGEATGGVVVSPTPVHLEGFGALPETPKALIKDP